MEDINMKTKNKTYTEKEGHKKFNWFKILSKECTVEHQNLYDDLSERAATWPTCAVGNQCNIIPRDERGCPKDNILEKLGILFYNKIDEVAQNLFKNTIISLEIANDNRLEALRIFEQIEERSAVLIKEIQS